MSPFLKPSTNLRHCLSVILYCSPSSLIESVDSIISLLRIFDRKSLVLSDIESYCASYTYKLLCTFLYVKIQKKEMILW